MDEEQDTGKCPRTPPKKVTYLEETFYRAAIAPFGSKAYPVGEDGEDD